MHGLLGTSRCCPFSRRDGDSTGEAECLGVGVYSIPIRIILSKKIYILLTLVSVLRVPYIVYVNLSMIPGLHKLFPHIAQRSLELRRAPSPTK